MFQKLYLGKTLELKEKRQPKTKTPSIRFVNNNRVRISVASRKNSLMQVKEAPTSLRLFRNTLGPSIQYSALVCQTTKVKLKEML